MYYICEKIIIILRWKSRWQKWISGSFKNHSSSDRIDSFRIELTISEGSVILSLILFRWFSLAFKKMSMFP